MVLVDLFNEFVFGHGLGRVIYMPALILESPDSLRADILKEEELKALVVHGVKDFWFSDVHDRAAAHPAESIVESGGDCWGDGDSYRGAGRVGRYDISWLRHYVQRRDERLREGLGK